MLRQFAAASNLCLNLVCGNWTISLCQTYHCMKCIW